MKIIRFRSLVLAALLASLVACSSPEEKAEKYYQKGMELLEKEPDKAKLEFQNALQIKKNMVKAMYGLALVSERKGEWKATFALMNKVVEQDPNHIEALIKTGQIFMAGGMLDMAQERSNRALAIDKNNVNALNLYAAIQLKLNNPQAAIEYANKTLAIDSSNQDAYVVLANERLNAKDDVKAVEYLDKALAKDEKNLAVQMIRVKTYESAAKLKEAEQAYQKVVQLFPDNAYVRKSYAQFLMTHARKEEAEQQIRAIAQAQPKNVQAKIDVVNFLISTRGPEAGRTELENFVKKEPENYELAFALVGLYQLQKQAAKEDALLADIAKKAGEAPEGLKAKAMMAGKQLAAGKKDEARKIANDILEIDKRNELALMLNASMALQDKNYDLAIADLRTLLRDSPDNARAALMLASAHENAGSPELAEEQLLKAFTVSKFDVAYGMPYVQFLIRRNQPERAEKVLEQMQEANPGNPNLLRALAQAKIARKDFAGAQELADKAKQLGGQGGLADQISGAISLSQNDLEGSLRAYKRAHEADPNAMQPIADMVRTYMQAGKSREAIGFIQSVLKANPNNLDAKLILGQLYAATGDMKRAADNFTQYIQARPDSSAGYQQLALSQQRAKQDNEALATVNEGLTKLPDDFGLKFLKAGMLGDAGQFEEAIKVYENMLKQRPDSEVVINNLASLYADHRADQTSIKRAYEISSPLKDSPIPQFLDTFGWVSFKMGKLDDAEKALKSAVEKSPETAVFYYHLAKVLLAKNNNVDAKQALQNAIKFAAKEPFEQKDDANALLKSL